VRFFILTECNSVSAANDSHWSIQEIRIARRGPVLPNDIPSSFLP
jgi:hypothetical protein